MQSLDIKRPAESASRVVVCHFDRLLPTVPLLLSVPLLRVSLLDVLLLTNCYRVLLPSVLPMTVLFYLAAPTVCFFTITTIVTITAVTAVIICCCYCCYYCCYYFWFTANLVTTSRKVRSQL